MTIWILPIEGHEQRYTGQWLHHLPVQLAQAAAARGVPASVIQIEGEIPPPVPLAGAFLDFAGTNIFKSTQIAEVARRFQRGEVQPGDTFLITDAWHPGVHQIRYMSALLRISVRVIGLFHAGHYDPNDFLGRIAPRDVTWAKAMERALFEAYGVSVFATHAHAELFRAGVGAAADDPRVAVCGWPMEYLAAELQPHLAQPKENIVLFPHRLAPEKQPEIFKDLAGSFPDWQFVACQETALSKWDYHDLLARSRVVFSCSLQETLGIGCYEGVLAGAAPVVPDRLSYREMYPQGFRYPAEWTASWEAYQRHKPELVAHLSAVLDRVVTGGYSLTACEQQLSRFFLGADLYDRVLAS
ncbi:hypothetical protein [Methylobacterium sp. SyP6R]|uniref:hypothetical protein n=1 Tax=Methylobacterium sp. SyP6R TaxID=2718876 RepID=UPI001F29A636|nr:hypothetical protein [Methylobacterium sp. SyP6R]MCF4123865.1 hypothetical protein [Methylobacterium sp. SyP6R]